MARSADPRPLSGAAFRTVERFALIAAGVIAWVLVASWETDARMDDRAPLTTAVGGIWVVAMVALHRFRPLPLSPAWPRILVGVVLWTIFGYFLIGTLFEALVDGLGPT